MTQQLPHFRFVARPDGAWDVMRSDGLHCAVAAAWDGGGFRIADAPKGSAMYNAPTASSLEALSKQLETHWGPLAGRSQCR